MAEWTEPVRNLEKRLESHDARHSLAVAEVWDEVERVKTDVLSLKLFNAKIIGIMLAVQVAGGVLTAMGIALLKR